MDQFDRIISCVRSEEVGDTDTWLDRHEEQASGEVLTDETAVSGDDSICVAYEPGVELDITYPSDQEWGDQMRDNLEDVLFKGSFGHVSVPARTGCDHIWGDTTDLGVFDSELTSPYYMAYTTVCMPPEDFLRIQYVMAKHAYGGEATQADFRRWLNDTHDEQVAVFREWITEGEPVSRGEEDFWHGRDEPVPRPYLELDREGELVASQEGRHRGIAAYREGVPLMDVYVFANYDSTRGDAEYKYPSPPAFPGGE